MSGQWGRLVHGSQGRERRTQTIATEAEDRQGKKTKDKPDFAKRKTRKKKNTKTRQKTGKDRAGPKVHGLCDL